MKLPLCLAGIGVGHATHMTGEEQIPLLAHLGFRARSTSILRPGPEGSHGSVYQGTFAAGIASKFVSLGQQVLTLFILALPVASVAWTVTHEAIFREMQEYCRAKSKSCRTVLQRKFFYLFTCEYCFSHYVSAIFLAITRFKLLFPDWRGYLISLFALVWVCNFYISIYNRLRLNIKHEHIAINEKQREVEATEEGGTKAA